MIFIVHSLITTLHLLDMSYVTMRMERTRQQARVFRFDKENYFLWENYIILPNIKYVVPLFIEVVGPIINLISEIYNIINLISEIYNFCERKEYAFNVLLGYNIITPLTKPKNLSKKY